MGLRFIPFRFPGVDGVACAFQMACPASPEATPAQRGNISLEAGLKDEETLVVANRQALRDELGLRGVAEVRQVHGVTTLFEPEPQNLCFRPEKEADGMAISRDSARELLGLMIKTADCQPLLIAHRDGNHIMALHVGWKGNRQEYPPIAVEEFCDRYHLKASDLSAVRGPSLGPGCAEFIGFDTEWGDAFAAFFERQSRCMDLWRLTREQLNRAGIPQEHIYGLDLCTRSLARDFFSYRADHGCGRQASLIWLETKTSIN